jgi:hypothetical protein
MGEQAERDTAGSDTRDPGTNRRVSSGMGGVTDGETQRHHLLDWKHGLCIGPRLWSQHHPEEQAERPQQPADASTGGMEPDVGAQDSRRASITQGAMRSKDQAMQDQSKACKAQTCIVWV